MSENQNARQLWLIKAHGVDNKRIEPGQTVIIGRKPLRAIEEPEGIIRVDIADSTKSMSKRHAQVAVADDGTASIQDLNSTNGSYIVGEKGELTRIPAGVPFEIENSPMRFQFGDVPVDFVSVDSQDIEDLNKSKSDNLFAYASAVATQEAAGASMSVDDILDLRAGEPTSMISTANVKSKIDALHDKALKNPELMEISDASETTSEAVLGNAADSSMPDENIALEQEPQTLPQESTRVEEEQSKYQAKPQQRTDIHDNFDQTQVGAFKPVFEAGSVFDRLSRGEFDKKQEIIEVGGFTSDDAKRTRDFDEQFEIARIEQLLPFLAMNPSLYDDMYAWLEALGNADVDTALAHNEGYNAWKNGQKK